MGLEKGTIPKTPGPTLQDTEGKEPDAWVLSLALDADKVPNLKSPCPPPTPKGHNHRYPTYNPASTSTHDPPGNPKPYTLNPKPYPKEYRKAPCQKNRPPTPGLQAARRYDG